jgi:hypothetical protein
MTLLNRNKLAFAVEDVAEVVIAAEGELAGRDR